MANDLQGEKPPGSPFAFFCGAEKASGQPYFFIATAFLCSTGSDEINVTVSQTAAMGCWPSVQGVVTV
jgi:hypothetical protein